MTLSGSGNKGIIADYMEASMGFLNTVMVNHYQHEDGHAPTGCNLIIHAFDLVNPKLTRIEKLYQGDNISNIWHLAS